MKAAAELVMHTARSHRFQRCSCHRERLGAVMVVAVAHQELKSDGPWEFGRATKAAVLRIEAALHPLECLLQDDRLQRGGCVAA